jgi:SAM-dependent methyltransferase
MRRVGWDVHARRPADVFDARGMEQWRFIKSLLPRSADLEGKHVLDFGCGAGRILRHAVTQDPAADYWACDIHGPSVRWLRSHLPAAHVFQTDAWPPLPQPDAYFQLAYAFSVFTHLVDSWSAWLLELRRVLTDDGLLVATVFGPGHTEFGGEPISEEVIGMNVLFPTASWDTGGPMVVHSDWWLRAHWGRAFEILELRPGDPTGPPPLYGQGVVVMRKRRGTIAMEDLERPEPGEPRELAAARQNVLSLRRELARHTGYLTSRSWRLTAPLRALGRGLRSL